MLTFSSVGEHIFKVIFSVRHKKDPNEAELSDFMSLKSPNVSGL